MIKPTLLVRLIKQRLLTHEERLNAVAVGDTTNMFDMYANASYRQAVQEEVAYLKALLHECAYPFSDAAR